MASSPDAERRRDRRLELAFPIRFTGRTPAGSPIEGQGLTVDISTSGVRFETTSAPALDPRSDLTFQIAIPQASDSPVFLSGGATVVRCDRLEAGARHLTGAHWGLAVRFHQRPDVSLPVLEDFRPSAPGC